MKNSFMYDDAHLWNSIPSEMDDPSYRLNFDLGKKNEFTQIYITTARKSVLKLVNLQSLVAKCCKMRKI